MSSGATVRPAPHSPSPHTVVTAAPCLVDGAAPLSYRDPCCSICTTIDATTRRVGDAMLVVDAHGLIRICGESFARRVGSARRELIGRPVHLVIPSLPLDFRVPATHGVRPASPEDRFEAIQWLTVADGTNIPVQVCCHTLPASEQCYTVIEIVDRDPDHAEDDLRRVTSAAECCAEAVIITDANGIIEFVNPAFETMTGFARDEVLGRTPRVLKSGAHGADFYRELWTTIRGGQVFRGVIANRRKSGEIFHEEKTIRPLADLAGCITHFIAAGHDVSERIRQFEQLAHAASHDGLTQLANRNRFLERLDEALCHARHDEAGFALVVIDVDRFKCINDELGHLAGDDVLKAVARRLQHSVRQVDTVARLGGDEFALILTDIREPATAASALEKIVSIFDSPVRLEARTVSVGVSVGCSLCPADGLMAAALLHRADQAMYAAKRAGGMRYRLYSTADPRAGVIDLSTAPGQACPPA